MTASTSSEGGVKPDCVVVDTNVWRSSLLLKTALGRSLVYLIDRLRAKLGLPSVIERELKSQIVEAGLEAHRAVEKHGRVLDTLTHVPFFPWETTAEDLEKAVDDRLSELTPILQRVPFTFQHAEAALDLVIKKLPPNGKSQQFKDSAIWQAVLELASTSRVHFVTRDTAFFAPSKESVIQLAANLAEECQLTGKEVMVYEDLATCLEALRGPEPHVDKEGIVDLIQPAIAAELRSFTRKNQFELGERRSFHLVVFRTDSPDAMAIDFEISANCIPIRLDGFPAGADFFAIAGGTCYYNSTSTQVTDVYLDSVVIKFESPTGHGMSTRTYDGDPTLTFYPPTQKIY